MSDKNFQNIFSQRSQQQYDRRNEGRYRFNRELRSDYNYDDAQENDRWNTQYDSTDSDKVENYKADGYYGSNYGSISELSRGRNFEQNVGYRDNYNQLTTGQWLEIDRAAKSRGMSMQQLQRATPGFMQQGPHKGKGPKSYKRSDARILEDIHDRLLEDPYVDATEIEVTVENGEVILAGVVEHKNVKRRAEDILEDVSGIKHLENRLRVRKPGGQITNIQNSNPA